MDRSKFSGGELEILAARSAPADRRGARRHVSVAASWLGHVYQDACSCATPYKFQSYRDSSGVNFREAVPVYRERGRISRLLSNCSIA